MEILPLFIFKNFRNNLMKDDIQNNSSKISKLDRHSTDNYHYSIGKMLRQTVSVNKRRPFAQFSTKYQKAKGLPSIMVKMKYNKQELESTIYRNHTRLNNSFSDYFQCEVNVSKNILLKKKMAKQKKVEENCEKIIQVQTMERDESSVLEANLKLSPLLNRCFDSLFPTIRYNATMVSLQDNVYLVGGYHQRHFQGFSHLHKYDFEGRKWVQIKSRGESPKIAPCFHTVDVFKNHLIILGGVNLDGEKSKKYNSQMLMFNLEKEEWLRARIGVSLKNHATTLFGSTLMISGGITERQKFNQDLIFISFGGGNVQNPLVFTVHNYGDKFEKISHHKLIHTYQLEPVVRNKIRMDGVFSFGGQDENGMVNNDLLFINVAGKINQNLDIKFKRWEVITVNEERPCPRKDHTFTIIKSRAIAVLAGGIEQYGNRLTDIWLFDLIRLSWIRVVTQPRIQDSLGPLACHCACSVGSIVYLYNGDVQNKRQKAFWALQTDINEYNKRRKNAYATKITSFKSFHSDKQNFQMDLN